MCHFFFKKNVHLNTRYPSFLFPKCWLENKILNHDQIHHKALPFIEECVHKLVVPFQRRKQNWRSQEMLAKERQTA